MSRDERVPSQQEPITTALNGRDLLIRVAGIALFIGCSIGFFYVASRMFSLQIAQVREFSVLLLLGAFVLSTVFTLVKALAWKIAFKAEEIDLSYYECVKIFSLSSLVDFLFFPSTISADLFKLAYLKNYGIAQKLRAIVLFRVATSSAYALVLIAYFAQVSVLLTLFGLLAFCLVVFRRYQPGAMAAYFRRVAWVFGALVLLTLLVICITFSRAYLLAGLFDAALPLRFLFEYVVSHFVGVLSAVPMGLGAKDLSLGYFLSEHLSTEQIGLFLILLRLSGEVYGALLGWLFSAGMSMGLFRDFLRQGKTERQTAGASVPFASAEDGELEQ